MPEEQPLQSGARLDRIESVLDQLAESQVATGQRIREIAESQALAAQERRASDALISQSMRESDAALGQRIREIAEVQVVAAQERRASDALISQSMRESDAALGQRIREIAEAQAVAAQETRAFDKKLRIIVADLAQTVQNLIVHHSSTADRLDATMAELAESQKHTDERLNSLINVVDGIIRRPPIQ